MGRRRWRPIGLVKFLGESRRPLALVGWRAARDYLRRDGLQPGQLRPVAGTVRRGWLEVLLDRPRTGRASDLPTALERLILTVRLQTYWSSRQIAAEFRRRDELLVGTAGQWRGDGASRLRAASLESAQGTQRWRTPDRLITRLGWPPPVASGRPRSVPLDAIPARHGPSSDPHRSSLHHPAGPAGDEPGPVR
jgi:hypothetical protein